MFQCWFPKTFQRLKKHQQGNLNQQNPWSERQPQYQPLLNHTPKQTCDRSIRYNNATAKHHCICKIIFYTMTMLYYTIVYKTMYYQKQYNTIQKTYHRLVLNECDKSKNRQESWRMNLWRPNRLPESQAHRPPRCLSFEICQALIHVSHYKYPNISTWWSSTKPNTWTQEHLSWTQLKYHFSSNTKCDSRICFNIKSQSLQSCIQSLLPQPHYRSKQTTEDFVGSIAVTIAERAGLPCSGSSMTLCTCR